jgi:hypothetical protein
LLISQILFPPVEEFLLSKPVGGYCMPKTNIIGSAIISIILLVIVGYALSIGMSIDWKIYAKIGAVVLIIAAIIGIASAGGDKA